MALEFEVDVLPPMECIGDMLDNLEGFYAGDIFTEFVAWQEEDMKRKYPAIVPAEGDIVYTMIYPRSRLSNKRKRGNRFYQMRQKGLRHARRGRFVKSNRPILRPQLFVQLCNRMAKLMREKLQWR